MKFKPALLCASLAALALASANAVACYTVYDASNRVVYDAQQAPVDMSLPLHDTLPRAFPGVPGVSMVFGNGGDCPREQLVWAPPAAPTAGSPLLTDQRTAAALHMPHTVLPSGVALIARRPDDMSAVAVAATPAIQPLDVPLAAAAVFTPDRPARHSTTVITEMRNPPMTVIQNGPVAMVTEVR